MSGSLPDAISSGSRSRRTGYLSRPGIRSDPSILSSHTARCAGSSRSCSTASGSLPRRMRSCIPSRPDTSPSSAGSACHIRILSAPPRCPSGSRCFRSRRIPLQSSDRSPSASSRAPSSSLFPPAGIPKPSPPVPGGSFRPKLSAMSLVPARHMYNASRSGTARSASAYRRSAGCSCCIPPAARTDGPKTVSSSLSAGSPLRSCTPSPGSGSRFAASASSVHPYRTYTVPCTRPAGPHTGTDPPGCHRADSFAGSH